MDTKRKALMPKSTNIEPSSASSFRRSYRQSSPIRKFPHCANFITLSQAMSDPSMSFDEQKISLVQKFVSTIDMLPKKYANVEIIYLSNNNVKSLFGIQQFKKLRSLSVANNEIDDVNTALYLQELPYLEVLNMSGNPLCKTPDYYESMISALPSLKSLDGKVISVEERQRSQVKNRAQSSLMGSLLQNHCSIILLGAIMNRLDLHRELLKKDQRFMWNFTTFRVQTLLGMINAHTALDVKEAAAYKMELMNAIHAISQEMRLRQDQAAMAYSELLIRQERKLVEISVEIEEKWKSLADAYKREQLSGRSSPILNSGRSELSSPPYASTCRTVSSFNNPKSAKREVNVSQERMPTAETAGTYRTTTHTNRVVFTENSEAEQIIQNGGKVPRDSDKSKSTMGSLQQDDTHTGRDSSSVMDTNRLATATFGHSGTLFSLPTDDFNLANEGVPEPKQLERLPSPKCPSLERSRAILDRIEIDLKTQKDNSKGGKKVKKDDDVTEEKIRKGLTSPLRSRVVAQEKMIDTLKTNLRDKTVEVESLVEINNKLRERQQNSKIAEYSSKLEDLATINETLKNELDFSRKQLEDLRSAAARQEMSNQMLKENNDQDDLYTQELEEYREAQQERRADIQQARHLLQTTFYHLLDSLTRQRAIRRMIQERNFWRDNALKKAVIRTWQTNFLVKKLIFQREEVRKARLLTYCFMEWKNIRKKLQNVKEYMKEKNEAILAKYLLPWKRFLALKHSDRQRKIKGLKFLMRNLIAKGFVGFRLNHIHYYYTPKEEKTLLKENERYHRLTVRRTIFQKWRRWVQEEQKPNRLNNLKAQLHRRVMLFSKGFLLMQQHQEMCQSIRTTAESKRKQHQRNIKQRIFKTWKAVVSNVIQKKKMLEEMQKRYIRSRLLQKWRDAKNVVVHLKKKTRIAQIFRNSYRKRAAFEKLKSLRERSKLHMRKRITIETSLKNKNQSATFRQWLELHRQKAFEKHEAQKGKIEILQSYFRAWNRFYRDAIIKKLRKKNLLKHLHFKEKSLLSGCIMAWRGVVQRKERNKLAMENFQKSLGLRLSCKILFALQRNLRCGMRKALLRMDQQKALLEVDVKSNELTVKELDKERGEAKGKHRDAQRFTAELQNKVELQEKEKAELVAELSSRTKSENMLQKELELVREKLMKLQNQDVMNINSQTKLEATIIELKRERDELKIKVSNSISELQEMKLKEAHSGQETQHSVQKATQKLQDMETKLKASIKMASEFKMVIEQKDIELIEMKGKLSLKNRINYDSQSVKSTCEGSTNESILQNEKRSYETLREDKMRLERQVSDLKSQLKAQTESVACTSRELTDITNISRISAKKPVYPRSSEKKKNSTHVTISDLLPLSPNGMESIEFNNTKSHGSEDFLAEKSRELKKRVNRLQNYLSEDQKENLFGQDNDELDESFDFSLEQPQKLSSLEHSKTDRRHSVHQSLVSDKTNSTTKKDPTNFVFELDYSASTNNGSRYTSVDSRVHRLHESARSSRIHNESVAQSSITEDSFAKSKAQRLSVRENLEKRIKSLRDNIQNDAVSARSRMNIQC